MPAEGWRRWEGRVGVDGEGDGEVDGPNSPSGFCGWTGKGKFSILRVPGMGDARARRWEGRVGVDVGNFPLSWLRADGKGRGFNFKGPWDGGCEGEEVGRGIVEYCWEYCCPQQNFL